jgi:hypothetical protein
LHHAVPSVQPKNFLDFVTNYKHNLGARRKEVTEMSQRLSHGLAKLVQVSGEVDVLQKDLAQAKVVVETATRECNHLLEVRFHWAWCVVSRRPAQ